MSGATTTSKGAVAEDLAVCYLEQQGYVVAARNHHAAHGEVDVVAWDGDTLCFVEVRSRAGTDHGRPENSVSRVKQRRVVHAAVDYMTREGIYDLVDARFDVVAVVGDQVELFKAAFEAGR